MNCCGKCANWKLGTKVTYEGSGVVIEHLHEKGLCDVLGVATDEDFGCNRFVEGPDQQIEMRSKPGEPWEHWVTGPCPDCSGVGSATDHACNRCAGTSRVRYYDDGFVGEEQTRLHPMEIRKVQEDKKAELMRQIDAIDVGMPPVVDPPKSDPTKLAPAPRPDVTGTGAVV